MRKKARWLAVGAVALAIVSGIAYYGVGRSRAREALGRARSVLVEAREVLADSEQRELTKLAAEEHASAASAVEAAEQLIAERTAAAALTASERALELARQARERGLGNLPISRAATLEALKNKVLYRAANGVAWSSASQGMSLFERDRVATKEHSEALIVFDAGTEMRVEESSVMVVERILESRLTAGLSMTLSLSEGGVRSLVNRERDRDVRLEINLPKAGIVVDTHALAEGRAEVGTRVHPDRSNRIAVYSGEAEVKGAEGETVVVRRNQFTEVSPDGKLSAPQELPPSAITLLPGRNATVYVSSNRPDVTFKWKSQVACPEYRLEVALDERFLEHAIDERVTRTSFTYGNLRPAGYFWRMCCVDAKGTQGGYSETTRFEVVLDDQAPRLSVLAPEANAVLSEAKIEARCRTEGEVAVFINGEEAAKVADGVYARAVALTPGLNTLVFEAIDLAGNVMYNSRLVTRRP